MATGGLMIAVAVGFDSLQFLGDIAYIGFILDSLVSFIASIIYGIWFSHHDISLMGPDRALGFLGTILGELVPGVNALPFFTFYITSTVIREWASSEEEI